MNSVKMALIFVLGLAACSNQPIPADQTRTANVGQQPVEVTALYFAIVVATRDLPNGTIISPDMVTTCVWLPALSADFAFTQIKDVIGRKTRVEIPRGTPVFSSQVLSETPATSSSSTTQAI